MKRTLLFLVTAMFLLVSWIGINRETFPPPPENITKMAATVNLKFKVTNKDASSVEMALNEGRGPNNLVVLFDLSKDWYKGNFGLVLTDLSESSSFRGRSGKQADISRFEKDNSGKTVKFYSFEQTLVKDDNGESYIQMSYAGAPMPLIQSLEIKEDFPLPRHISARFVNKGNITFLAGKYGLDNAINGFWIPVKLN
jgi:nitrous oxide reductase accessory protein NosL